ncbi:MAG: gamma carbonic anhydrase family protein [Nitrososphaerota archaeon]|nr:gamma carbonic anhydrase family protein [Nitrososphaerales archaeon]MDW8045319.1 gamma carbonic anhydrase family protein [Nitrososphaerota archaeon]
MKSYNEKNIIAIDGRLPKLGSNTFIDPDARIMGDVRIGDNSSVWYGSLVKGEINPTEIGDESVIADHCLIEDSKLGRRVLISHGAILHRCTIEDEVLVGVGAIVLDGAYIERGSIIGAGSLVTSNTRIPKESIAIGQPAKVLRELRKEDKEYFQRALDEAFSKSKMYMRIFKKHL